MSTVLELDTEIAAKIVANLTGPPTRLLNDFNDTAGELIPSDTYRFRQRLEVLVEEVQGSNVTNDVINAELDFIVRMNRVSAPLAPRDYTPDIWTDQQQLVQNSFWTDMAAVKEVLPGEQPGVVEEITQNGELLIYTVQVALILQP